MSNEIFPEDRLVAMVYPSIAATIVGRVLGALYESIPIRLGSVKLSHLIFVLPTIPIALGMYLALKIAGPRYLLTTHRLRFLQGISGRAGTEIPLEEVGRVDVVEVFGQKFFKAGDLVVHDHVGIQRLRFAGIVRPEMFRQTILDARDALVRTDAARRAIEARQTGGALRPEPSGISGR
jgi:hypothetical protein